MITSQNNSWYRSVVHGTYYPHIDGIRALAILPVLLYHLCASLCPGGYAGVDVFFVISGYLITGGILKNVAENKFSISEFYRKRIIRIFPAYFAMILGTLLAGAILFYSGPLRWLGNATLTSTLFIANIFYAKSGSGYFHGINEDSPCLNLWSLGVEEQFYLFVPLLILILAKFKASYLQVFSLIFLISLIWAEIAIRNGNINAAFFYLQFRCWELATGSLLAIFMSQRANLGTTGQPLRNGLNLLGLILVLVPYFLYTHQTPFPGLHAIPSVAGAALLIRYGDMGIGGRLLRLRWMTFVGKISYSLYLWHWPVISFWSYFRYAEYFGKAVLGTTDYVGMLILSLGLGYLSWRFIEMPFRLATIPKKRAFQFAAAGMGSIVLISILTITTDGWRNYLHHNANRFAAAAPRYQSFFEPRLKELGVFLKTKRWDQQPHPLLVGSSGVDPEFMILGDSFAGNLEYGADLVAKRAGISGVLFSASGCQVYEKHSESAAHIIQKATEYFNSIKTIRTIIIRQSWPKAFNQQDLIDTCKMFKQRGTDVFLVSSSPNWSCADSNMFYGPSDLYAKSHLISNEQVMKYCVMDSARFAALNNTIDKNLADAAKKSGSDLINARDALKSGDVYLSNDPITGNSYYTDEAHLDSAASVKIAELVLQLHFSRKVSE